MYADRFSRNTMFSGKNIFFDFYLTAMISFHADLFNLTFKFKLIINKTKFIYSPLNVTF